MVSFNKRGGYLNQNKGSQLDVEISKGGTETFRHRKANFSCHFKTESSTGKS